MIKKEKFEELLKRLDYLKNQNTYIKFFDYNISIKVDLKNEKIIYPADIKVHDTTTSNFDHPENFVVFECVNRLLEKGYNAKNIELEPKWKLGRGNSGGKADILIKDYNGHEYLIIECKTFGGEFNKEWNKTLSNGGQLFSYAQQIKRTKYLCLYASDLIENEIKYVNKIIVLQDNEEYLKTIKISKRLRYKDATDVKELHKVWHDIYNCECEERGIFEKKVQPYRICEKSYDVTELQKLNFDDSQKKYNEFATILRQHNVSGHENAFDKLVNIFLAKIVDEIEHPNNLKFNWKGIAYDDYYQLQDRLQTLYKEGMQKFLNEEVTYIDNKQLNDVFKLFKNDPDATKDKVLEYFRELKFYTNNDFSFIDVHNKDLFMQNSEVLLKIVKMFQDIQLKTNEQNQFLGDLFEGFLDDGIKQSEGQFFTPLPITRFIISSLPLEDILKNNGQPPKVIDYACGAGHFLTEYAMQIKQFIPQNELQDYYSSIDGIEKEYRLSKVSKVSAFMYGQDNINIIYGDALAENKKIKDDSYSILIANPPYAVKGFLETLEDESRQKYELTNLINSNTYTTNNSIEAFFVERAKQLLKSNGVAGIILPSSILTNGNSIYTKAREIILKYFDIIGIVEFGNGTFGATGTNTVTLFLRKREENPSIVEHYKNRVDSWFDNDFSKDQVFEDKKLLLEYLKMQNIELDDYIQFINKDINNNLRENELFKQYLNSNKVKDIEDIISIEKEKLYFFMLAYSQQNRVVVVNCPSKSADIKKYLGYEWSNRKGNEGIKYIGAIDYDEEHSLSRNKGIASINTSLFNPENLFDKNKINSIIRDNFNNIEHDEMPDNVIYNNLVNLLNFKKDTFDKNINLSSSKEIKVESKYPTKHLESLLVEIKGNKTKIRDNELIEDGKIPVISQRKDNLINGYTNNVNVITDLPLIVFGDHTCAVKYIDFDFVRGADGTQLLKFNENEVITKYIYYFLNFIDIKNKNKYERHMKYLKNQLIPIPPIEVQKEIVEKCENVDKEYDEITVEINEYQNKIKKELEKKENQAKSRTISLSDKNKFVLSIGSRVLKSELVDNGKIPVISANVHVVFGNTDKEIISDYKYPYILWGIDGDWMVRYLDKGIKFYPTDHCGFIKVLDKDINPKYLSIVIENIGSQQRFSRTHRASIDRVSALKLSIPSIKIQNKIIQRIEKFERNISDLKIQLKELENKKKEIIDSYELISLKD